MRRMPIIQSAKKALKQSKKRTKTNQAKKFALHTAFRQLKKEKKPSLLKKVYQLADKAAKDHIIHKNKAARIKRSASKLIPAQTIKKPTPKTKSPK